MKFNKQLFQIGILFIISNVAYADQDHRWYSKEQVQQGQVLFQQNCASCHGEKGEATSNWKDTDANGNYPPPPINGTGHAWHHDLKLLKMTIKEGGKKLGGVMPPFRDKLSDDNINQVVAFFQSQWPDEVFQKWSGRFEKTELPSISKTVDTSNNAITRLLRQRVGGANVSEPEKTNIDGVWQVKYNNRYVYLLNEGKYAMFGDVINLENGINLTKKAAQEMVVPELAKYRDEDLVVFEPAGITKATLDIFTDTSCPYCRKLHKELPKLLNAGIKVRYLPYARGGVKGPGYQTLKSVWCAKDRKKAMTDAKNEDTGNLPAGTCDAAQIVDRAYITGNQVGVTGTPALFKENGEKIVGYVPFQKLIPVVLK
jgi:thiol:disulfide interchange protein DsbC